MPVAVVTPPSATPISLAEAKDHLRVDWADDDASITRMIETATAMFDGPDATLGRCLMKQSLEMKIDTFPCGASGFDIFDRLRYRTLDIPHSYHSWNQYLRAQEIPLPYPPVIGTVSITYLDQDGASQTLPSSVYRLLGGGSAPTRVGLKQGQSWPAIESLAEAITIQWDAGYGETGKDVPAPIRHAILLTVGHLYENRQSVVVDASRVQAIELPQGAQALVAPYRIFS
jgi:uncharacterized phiE125 gp8 family phage protein